MDYKGKTKMRESGEMDYEGKTKKRKLGTAENDPLASANGGEYEVFLSFTGKDTRKGFTDFLYNDLDEKGIHTFRDDDELRVGEEIGPELLQAIKESKISIPIFSQNYASSKWCLLELAQMVVCQKTMGQKILPIFYDVEPCDVRYQTGSYEEAFRQHEEAARLHKKGFDEKKVQEWREALREVGQLKGWELEKINNGHEGKLVKIVVEEVLSQLKKNYMVVTDNLVGIDHHIGEMKRLLNVDSNDVRIVGICGMGGLGKTTIAKFVYNKLFECFDRCCFLADVREKAQQYSGLVDLQKQLISEIIKGKSPDIANVDVGIKMIEDMACKKKVLIVLDDVDNESQLPKLVGKCDRFGFGSRIIVTTRNKGVLNVFDVYEAYEPQPMELDDALQLFRKCAFRKNFPLEDYDDLSKKVVSTTGGLPLALEIIGSLLYRKGKDVWEDTLEKLKVIPHDQVQKQLRISYDALNYEEKQIFLDVACFFIGENKTRPFYMWNDCKYYPRSGINSLVLRSLVKIGDVNEFRMHDQLRDLGREIVRQENIEDPGKRSRLWSYEEALDVLDGRMGTKKVEALCLQTYGQKTGEHSSIRRKSLTNDDFEKLPNLRFLQVECQDLNGDFKNLFSKLRWLRWHMCTDNSNPINFHLKNLVILDLSFSCITENWEGWNQIKMARLKVLDLSYCKDLTITPDLSNLVMLKRLVLLGCYKLVEVRGLTGLKSLEDLVMRWCPSLERLRDLSNSVMLKSLYLCECDKLVEVRGLTGLKSLEELYMDSCTFLERLPDLSNLVMLKSLVLSVCHCLVEVRGLTGLKSLEELDMRRCESLERLPDLSNLLMLKRLVLRGCDKLVEVRGLTGLKSLEELDMSGCTSLEKLLDLSNLVMLKRLDLSQCDKLVEVRGLTGLKSLEELDMSSCTFLERLPDLSNLVMLKRLHLCARKLVEVRGLAGLKSLEELNMSGCPSLERLPDLSNLVMLKRLVLSNCNCLVEVRGLTGLKSLEELDMSWCRSLERLLDLSNLVMLKRLVLLRCDKLVEVRGLTGLKSLQELYMSWCTFLETDLSNLVMLKRLVLSSCDKLVEVRGLAGLKSLEELNMSLCLSVVRLPDLSNLLMLKRLDLSSCFKLVEFRGFTGLKSLEELDMSYCGSVERLPDLSNLVMLKRLVLCRCDKLVEVRDLTGLKSLEELDMSYCGSVERLPDLSNLVMLKRLDLYACDKLVEVSGLAGLKSLEELDMSYCISLERLPDLSNLEMLKRLVVFGCTKLVEVRGLTGLKSLEKLDMSWCVSLERLPDLSNLVMLKRLVLCACDKLVEVRAPFRCEVVREF